MSKPANHEDYIDSAPDWSKPILETIRTAFHKAGSLNEEMKWSYPHFTQKGIIGGMAAFKKHVNIYFWNAASLDDPKHLLDKVGKTKMGCIKVKSEHDLPSQATITKWAKQAMKLDAAN